MHTQNHNGVRFHHNGDYSGNVIVTCDGKEIEVPVDALVGFVAEYVRDNRMDQLEQREENSIADVAKLENMSDEEILGFRRS